MTVNQSRALMSFIFAFALGMTTAWADQSDTLAGRAWIAEDINGKGVMDTLQTTLEFAEEGKVGGDGGCNRYFGTVKIEGNSIKFGPLASTRKMCPESIMNQEDAFMRTLATVRHWKIKQTGLLYLYAQGDEPVLRFSEISEK